MAHINSFPDEVLLAIFGRIDDGVTLLDGVSLVCRRWSCLSREPWAWAGVRLEVPECGKHVARMCPRRRNVDAERVLLHAPALRSLFVNNNLHCESYGVRVRSAMRRSVAVVRELGLAAPGSCAPPGDAFASAAVQLVRHCRPHLRRLHVQDPDLVCWRGDDGEAFFSELAALRSLERLHLTVAMDLRYRGQLASASLPRLRHLNMLVMVVVRDHAAWGDAVERVTSCAVDLVGAAAKSLRRLDVTPLSLVQPWWPELPELIEAVARVGGLRFNPRSVAERPGVLIPWLLKHP